MLHLTGALVHGLVGAALFLLLRRARCGLAGTTVATALFLVFSAHWQVPFWPAAIPTGLAAAAFLVLCLLHLRFIGRPWNWPTLGALALTAFAIPCLNEQPAAAIPALLLLTPLARNGAPPGARGRAAAATAIALAAVALYLTLYWVTAPPDHRGSFASFTTGAELPDKWARTIGQIRQVFFLGHGFAAGAWIQGVSELGRTPILAATLLVALIAAGSLCLRRGESGASMPPDDRRPVRAPAQLTAFGLAVWALNWFPVLALRVQGVEPRLCYAPALGLAAAIAGVLQLLPSPAGLLARGTLRILGASAAAGLILGGTVMMIGIQGALRARWLRDEDEARQLRALVPDPPPRAILIPMMSRSRGTTTGRDHFDDCFYGPLERPWSAPFYVRRIFAQPDFDAAWRDRSWGRPPVIGAERRGIRYDDQSLRAPSQLAGDYERDAGGAKLLPWDRAIPFLIDHDGRVKLVATITVEGEPGNFIDFPVPQVRAQNPPTPATITVRFGRGSRGNFTITEAR